MTWKLRNDEENDLVFNYVGLVTLLALYVIVASTRYPFWDVVTQLVFPFIWILFGAVVQTCQYRISLYATFYGVAMQLFCFCLVAGLLTAGIALLVFSEALGTAGPWFLTVWVLSAAVSHILLTLFRRTIVAVWWQIRRK